MMWSLFGQNRGFLLQVPRGRPAAKAAGGAAAKAAGGAGEDLQLKPLAKAAVEAEAAEAALATPQRIP
jgi:hypothetical protein